MEMNGTIFIDRSPDVVFAYVIDVANDIHWREGVDESGFREDQPASVGAIGYTRAGDAEVTWRVVTYNAGEKVEWEFLNGPFLGRGGYLLEPANGGTQFTLLADIEPAGLYRLLGPLFARMGRRRNQSDVEKLRAILESDPGF